ncbi:MAG: NADH:ubiquinone reductase (Na(+)-transporting) subunit C [Bacteroidetes bacterium RIFCSPHIGHO2_02_FULL_44_7]|nr:MAG: NADH:ubiquinone reductase (Na(+)-transporting) subunit C [Bacteroidetes bacterium RIFCSPHIGHO2_02_FULL_44_7]
MILNKESNGYTFGFAVILVVAVGAILAILALVLKPYIAANGVQKQQMDILSAFVDLEKEGISRRNVEEKFAKYVKLSDAIVLDMNGNVREGVDAFKVDIRAEYKDKNLKDADKNYPLFIAKKDGKTLYIIPVVGKGLWGPIWGNICLGEDMNTIQGASFGHKGETPGLGAEIAQPFFVDRWIGEKLMDENGVFAKFEIVKDNSGGAMEKKVDGITGGTITSKGVEEMANRCLAVYATYFSNLKNSQ